MSNLFTAYAVQLTGAGVIGGITRQSLPFNHEVSAEATAGSPYARLALKRGSKPTYSFTTKDVRVALGYLGTEGAKDKSGATITAANFFEVQLDECGKPISSGSVHRKIASTLACLFPRRLTVSAGGDAELEVEVIFLSTDGVANPLAVSAIAIGALPALPTSEERYTIGPAKIDTITIDKLTQLTIDFGITAESVVTGSGVAPTLMSVPSVLPKIEFSGHGVDLYADTGAIPLGGINGEHANTEFWLRKRQAGGVGLVAGTETEHMKVTADGLAVINTTGGDANRPKTISGTLHCKHDNTNTPIVLTGQDNIVDP